MDGSGEIYFLMYYNTGVYARDGQMDGCESTYVGPNL
jgi:hypothetical protein